MDFAFYLKFFFALVAIINPVGLLPVFVGLTSDQTSEQRNHTGDVANFAVIIILIISLIAGQAILEVFNVSIPAFRIAGGILIAIIALSMLQGKLGEVKSNKEEDREFAAKDSVAVVPLALPLMAGPGAISSVVVYAAQYDSWQDTLGMSLAIIAFGLCSWMIFRLAPIIYKVLGKTGINVITRIMGLIMLAIAIEVMAAGLKGLFPQILS
ncbi:YchE family NAAT transporter [Paraferrimonas sp. SM1919]|uniref:YchE family NAAT transporter n=1 Tax=Paraferrimonas sp. SM1919 TaxID=2662263 RepID=UPI0013D38E04|nr:YchE family NAAT transporter [Paraferrimonas sp. SM1919]